MVNAAANLLLDHRNFANLNLPSFNDRPLDRRHVLGDAAVNFTLKVLDDFAATFCPPVVGGADGRAVAHH